MGNSHKINKYLKSFAKYGIRLLPPEVNKSSAGFAVEGNDVRYGLSAIKNVGIQFPKDVEKERTQNGNFASFSDFILRMAKYDTNRRTIETLIKVGVFDSLYPNRKALCMSFERMMDIADDEVRHSMAGQLSLFDSGDSEPAVSDSMISQAVEDYTLPQKLAYEKDFAGIYLFSHPLDPYLLKSKVYSETNIYKIIENPTNSRVKLCGVISSIRKKRTKSGMLMVNMQLGDYYSDIELTAFENTYGRYSAHIVEGTAVYVEATVNNRGDGLISLTLNNLVPLDSLGVPDSKKLYVRIDDGCMLDGVMDITQKYPGNSSLYLYVNSTGMLYAGDNSRNVHLCNELVSELIEKYGDDNVKFK